MENIKFKIVTSERVVYENDSVGQITIPTTSGEITVLPSHIPLISTLKSGELHLKDKTGDHAIALAGGFLEVDSQNQVTILADNAERAEEIDITRAEAAKKRAEEEMLRGSAQNIDFARLQAVIDREMNRIRVGRKYQKFPPAEFKKISSEDTGE